jgi:transposase
MTSYRHRNSSSGRLRVTCWRTRDTTRRSFATFSRKRGCVPVIPTRDCCTTKRPYDKEMYRARCEVECTFNLLEQARRFATRYEKTRRNYTAVVAIGCALLWLRI